MLHKFMKAIHVPADHHTSNKSNINWPHISKSQIIILPSKEVLKNIAWDHIAGPFSKQNDATPLTLKNILVMHFQLMIMGELRA